MILQAIWNWIWLKLDTLYNVSPHNLFISDEYPRDWAGHRRANKQNQRNNERTRNVGKCPRSSHVDIACTTPQMVG